MADRVRKNDDKLLLALACGATVEAAAKQCALTDRTIYRRLNDPAFKARLADLRGDMVRRCAGMLTAAAGEAVRTLLSLQGGSTPPATRLGAARAILELGLKVREVAELEARMTELEALVKGTEQQHPQGPSW